MFKPLLRTSAICIASLILLIFVIFYHLSPSVLIRPTGGIGNQLFQYAAAYSLSQETGYKLIVLSKKSQSAVKDNVSGLDRQLALNQFNIENDTLFAKDSLRAYIINLLFDKNIGPSARKVLSYMGIETIIVKNDNFSELSKTKKARIYIIHDYFESDTYFKNHDQKIRDLFTLKSIDHNKLDKYLDKLRAPESVCIHVIRGDVSPTQHAVLYIPIDYQKQAINLARKMIPGAHFYVFSDSIEAVKQELADESTIDYVSNPELLPLDDFTLMSSCANNIITNSTFSWWAGYLNSNPNKIIISPSNRFSNDLVESGVKGVFINNDQLQNAGSRLP